MSDFNKEEEELLEGGEWAVTKTRTGLGLDWRWTGDGLEHFSILTHLNIYFHKVTDIIGAPCSLVHT